MTKGHCFRCKEDQEIEKTFDDKLKNGRKVLKGVCKKCGCRITKFL